MYPLLGSGHWRAMETVWIYVDNAEEPHVRELI